MRFPKSVYYLSFFADLQVATAAPEADLPKRDQQQHAIKYDSDGRMQRSLRHRSAYPDPKSSPHPDCNLSDMMLQDHRYSTRYEQQQQKQQHCEAWCNAINAERSMSSSTHSFSFQSIREFLSRSSIRKSSSISSSTLSSSSWFKYGRNSA